MSAADPELRRQRILATVDSIPPGSVASFGQVAREVGLPRHARFVGRVLREDAGGTGVPWWRVVGADGRIPERGDGSEGAVQRRRLVDEGVRFDPRGRIRMGEHAWRP